MDTSPFEAHPDGVRLFLHLTPGASKNALVRLGPDANNQMRLRALVTTVPEQGKANKAIIKILAKKLRLPRSDIRIIAGQQSREKTLLLSGNPANLLDRLSCLLTESGM